MNNAVTAYLKDNHDRFLEALKSWLPWRAGPGLPTDCRSRWKFFWKERRKRAASPSVPMCDPMRLAPCGRVIEPGSADPGAIDGIRSAGRRTVCTQRKIQPRTVWKGHVHRGRFSGPAPASGL